MSLYRVKIYHVKIPDIFKILLYWEPEPYPGYRKSLEYSLHKTHNSRNPAI